MKKVYTFLTLVYTFFILTLTSTAFEMPTTPTGYVNDYAGVLSESKKVELSTQLSAFEASTTNQIAIVIVPDMNGDYIENYANTLFRSWGIGTDENNNGVLFLLAMEERENRIEVGYGLEGVLTDLISSSILREIRPSLQAGDLDTAVQTAADTIILATQGEYTATEAGESGSVLWGNLIPVFMAFWFIPFIILDWIIAILGRTKSWWLGGVFGAVGGGIVVLFVGVAFWPILLFLIPSGLLFDYLISRNYKEAVRGGRNSSWWSGGGWGPGGFGGGSGGGGSFGGFGGGSSGGGGASGRW